MPRSLRPPSTFVITPRIRRAHLLSSRKEVKQRWGDHAREFPVSFIMAVLGAAGMPLEWTRWFNRNQHRPRYWLEQRLRRLGLVWSAWRVRTYRVPKSVDALGDEAELRQFVAHMTARKGRYGVVTSLGPYWFTEPGDKLINREIVHPKTNARYLDGAVGYRFDEYFFTFVVLPYRFREIEPAVVMAILFPHIETASIKFLPDEPVWETASRLGWA